MPSSRNYILKNLYGITLEDYENILKAQHGCCAICGKIQLKPLDVDHDHVTGKVRGLLCHRCNYILGRWADDPVMFQRAADYLKGKKVKRLIKPS